MNRNLKDSPLMQISPPPPSRNCAPSSACARRSASSAISRSRATSSKKLLARAIPPRTPGAVFAAHNQAASNVGEISTMSLSAVLTKPTSRLAMSPAKGFPLLFSWRRPSARCNSSFAMTTSPSDALARLNSDAERAHHPRHVRHDDRGPRYPSANRIELASAGHCKPVMLRADGSAFEIETDGSLLWAFCPRFPTVKARSICIPGTGSSATRTGFRVEGFRR